ncbi:peptidoglycan/LPS O-acetylase OafA/YrhL [Homoserinimonas aerilata]|uniref:Peptidoglycan/LPS O-acetylase OafA/YrhL n=1 Tax=Homoserinimonas aerilata TaxID=1162970 RepID=A0A542YKM8_9MICO|nr:acyltransferase [Homoserinimonas aerilata]TQL48645.1 peptidoglycan/LPS O-acetylase OafA/YrhL [Homoserinimonas aerilata]
MTSASTAEGLPPNPPAPAERKPFRSLSDGMAGHRNSLGVLRLVLAGLVIFSHAFPLGGWGDDPMRSWTRNQESIGGFAVVGFFAISGYLIAKSGAGSDILQFMWRRVLRIFPAFWLVLIVGAVIVGPIVWLMDGNRPGGYLTNLGAGGPVGYVLLNADLTIRQWGIYDIFISTPWGERGGASALNGSLWTLAYEWSCYLIIALFVLLGILKRAKWIVPLVTLFYFGVALSTIVAPGFAASIFPAFGDSFRITLTLIFLIGSCMGLYSRSIPLDDRLGILSAIVVVASLALGGWIIVGYPAFAYLLLWGASRLPQRVQWIGAKNDYSYGVYVYGFLVQQFTAYLGWHHWGYVPWVLATIIVTGGCAWLSWHLVEKRAMQLKDFGPGRGIRYWFDWARQRFGRNSEKIKAAPQE